MKRMLIGLLFLAAASPLRAGVYDLDEPPRAMGAAGWNVVYAILELRAVPTPPPKGQEPSGGGALAEALRRAAEKNGGKRA